MGWLEPPNPLIGDPTPRFGQDPGPLAPSLLAALRQSGAEVSDDLALRALHARDWWPLSIGWANRGIVGALPQAVVRVSSTEQVQVVVRACNDAGVAIAPGGGRSGVCAGLIPEHGGIALDLTGLTHIRSIAVDSQSVWVEAGLKGPDLEVALQGKGLTLGHFPQSFELASVGGWLACRGAGQYSTRYGKIEDMVRGLEVVLADGTVVHTGGDGPRSATGPDLTQLFVGSEGTLGIITAAHFSLHRRPTAELRRAASFSSFEQGMTACREILQSGGRPAVLRLYDAVESERNFDRATNLLIVLDEASPEELSTTASILDTVLAEAQVEDVGLVERWLEHRNNVGQLAPLWERHIVVDTVEMAGPWSALEQARVGVLDALRAVPGTLAASVHESHAYLDGACLYFTFVGSPEGADGDVAIEEAYYRAAWDAASNAIIEAGCALSHHHGIGRHRARYLPQALGAAFGVLESMKSALDPKGILNPGVLGLGETSLP